MAKVDYKELYRLQDEVLREIFMTDHDFYLTGGTCLSRFYHHKRYSLDLGFFNHNNDLYSSQLIEIQTSLDKHFTVAVSVKAKDFTRVLIDETLQIDFVNERIPRMDLIIILDSGIKIDSIDNMLSNKLTAVMGRDDPKDIFDIYLIARYYSFSWKAILESCRDKLAFNLEDLVMRLKTFPQELFTMLNLVDKNFLDDFDDKYPVIIDEIIHTTNHQQWDQE
ncbi:MAG: nucleotidyl transferase AbiEii/AbiGii toxin family protein [Candidatus Marinimicrobia bacterium]|nr:nucleotidyl transferase AbiEii/AbiGii toxin family protein [Candidatus Neomarinimicrobiota bacterium]MBL7047841.1 nucleotidyl transferase AbiEii/AbiGii toxin family protein [Candidatus Neomarinimicrobiota bacterium]